jgi:hypothetical protein
LVNPLIQQDFHGASYASNSRQTKFLAFLQDLDGELSVDRGEAFQKFIERFTVLDVVEQRLHGDTSATKHGRSMHHFGIACNGFLHDSIFAQNGAAKVARLINGDVGRRRLRCDASYRLRGRRRRRQPSSNGFPFGARPNAIELIRIRPTVG